LQTIAARGYAFICSHSSAAWPQCVTPVSALHQAAVTRVIDSISDTVNIYSQRASSVGVTKTVSCLICLLHVRPNNTPDRTVR